MHQAETAKKLRGLPAFFTATDVSLGYWTFLLQQESFFWPSFLRGSKSRKNHSNQNCPRGEGAIAKSTIIHTTQLNAKKGPLVIVNALLFFLFLLFRKLDMWRPEGPYATKKQLCICELVLLLLLQYTSFNQGPLWPLNLRLTIACLQSIRPCNLYWIIKYVNLVFEDQRTSNVLLLKV